MNCEKEMIKSDGLYRDVQTKLLKVLANFAEVLPLYATYASGRYGDPRYYKNLEELKNDAMALHGASVTWKTQILDFDDQFKKEMKKGDLFDKMQRDKMRKKELMHECNGVTEYVTEANKRATAALDASVSFSKFFLELLDPKKRPKHFPGIPDIVTG